jgi:RNA polymerase sigma-70 factor (ECF subfamily)
MLEDELLKFRFLCGSSTALARIYEKYADQLLALAGGLLSDANVAQDVLHDVFLKFAQSNSTFRLTGNLWSYLATCVVNRARDLRRQRKSAKVQTGSCWADQAAVAEPFEALVSAEDARRAARALAELPYEQREAVLLHVTAGMRFREVAKVQGVSLRTAQGRYRYAMQRLRSMLVQGDAS